MQLLRKDVLEWTMLKTLMIEVLVMLSLESLAISVLLFSDYGVFSQFK